MLTNKYGTTISIIDSEGKNILEYGKILFEQFTIDYKLNKLPSVTIDLKNISQDTENIDLSLWKDWSDKYKFLTLNYIIKQTNEEKDNKINSIRIGITKVEFKGRSIRLFGIGLAEDFYFKLLSRSLHGSCKSVLVELLQGTGVKLKDTELLSYYIDYYQLNESNWFTLNRLLSGFSFCINEHYLTIIDKSSITTSNVEVKPTYFTRDRFYNRLGNIYQFGDFIQVSNYNSYNLSRVTDKNLLKDLLKYSTDNVDSFYESVVDYSIMYPNLNTGDTIGVYNIQDTVKLSLVTERFIKVNVNEGIKNLLGIRTYDFY